MNDPTGREQPGEEVVRAYLSHRLDAERAQAFETYCLTHPDFAHRVELDLLFKTGLAQAASLGASPPARTRRHIAWAMAASLILVVGCGLLMLARMHSGALIAYGSSTAVPAGLRSGPQASVTLIRLREGSAVHRIAAPRNTGILVVRVAPDSPPGRLGYTVGIASESKVLPRTVTLDRLRANADGYVETYLPFAAVAGQTLKVTVAAYPSTDASALSFELQVAYAGDLPADAP